MSPYAAIYLIANIVPAILGALALILYTHLLSPAQYGLYVIAASIAGIVSALFFNWVRLSVSRYQATSPELDLRPEAAVAYGGTVIAVACLAPLVIFVVRPDISFGILAGSLFLSLSVTAFELGQEFRRARLDPRQYIIVAVTRSVLWLVLGYLAVKLGGGGLGLVAAFGASCLIANAVGFRGEQVKAARPLRACSSDHLRQFVRYGAPLSLGALIIALHNSVDRLGIAYLLGDSAAGYYGLAADITRQVIVLLGSSVASAMFPVAFRSLALSGAAATRARLAEGAELLLALIAPVTVGLAICANLIAGTLLGSQFQATVTMLLPILAVARLCGTVNQFYLHASFQLAEKPLLQLAHDALVLTVNLALLIPLTLSFGLLGTAAAMLIAEGLGVVIGIWLSRKAFVLPFNGAGMARVLAATCVMAAVTYAVKAAYGGQSTLALLSVMAGGGFAYAGAAFLLDVAGVRSSLVAIVAPRRLAAE